MRLNRLLNDIPLSLSEIRLFPVVEIVRFG
jgi:hypothetical protein